MACNNEFRQNIRSHSWSVFLFGQWPKQGAAGDQARWRGERSGLCKVHRPTRRPMEGAVLFRPIMWLYSASGVLRFVPFQPAPYFDHLPTRCTLFWPLPN